jgi:site-specific DNA-methyltransferase (adenine-specific)/modification methylase
VTPYYDDGTCTIYHGDCREVLPYLAADLVLTDPPYGQAGRLHAGGVVSRARKPPHGKNAGIRPRYWPPIAGDDAPFDPEPLLAFPRAVLFGANWYTDRLPVSGSWIIWDKKGDGFEGWNGADAELAWTNLGGPVRVFRHRWMGVMRDSEIGQPHLHPAQKPVALMAWIIVNGTKPGDLILDPYMGSGPVLRAAKDLGRRAIGIEIEERYCEIAARRLGQEVLAL